MSGDFAWTDENVARMKQPYADGRSASQIGAILGCSRSAVCGKAQRIGVVHPNARPARNRRTDDDRPATAVVHRHAPNRATPLSPDAATAPLPPLPAEAAAFDAGRLDAAQPLARLERHACKFAVTSNKVAPAEHLFCAAPVADREAGGNAARYCAHHLMRVRVFPSATGPAGEAA